MAFCYVVTLDPAGSPIGGFSDVTGLGAENEVETLRVGGMNNTEVQLPGPVKFPSRLVLKSGLADERRLWKWYSDTLKGAITRKDVTITLKSLDGQKSAAWSFHAACPVKWTGPELHSLTSAVAFESIELIHRGFLSPAG
jgi:phage tail-like protein